MSKKLPQTLKGFRDFLPAEMKLRQQVLSIMQKTFELYGFEPLETPAIEYAELLLGKYGDEADKLVYTFTDRGERQVALKYDQTVPTARVIAQYQDKLPFPFRRYQIQPVWRAEKPQKGRYREFLQCDIDIFGTTSSLADAEVITTAAATLANVGLPNYTILINDRKILFQTLEKAGIEKDMQFSVIQTLDKLDKKDRAEVEAELVKKGLTTDAIQKLFLTFDKATPSDELLELMANAKKLGVPEQKIQFSPSLARGLNYYTSTIFEYKVEGYSAGSVAGGGRYDNLIADLSGVPMPAVGLAFGFDRLVEAVQEVAGLSDTTASTSVLISVFDKSLTDASIATAQFLRKNRISCELYPDYNVKLEKQLKYADKKGIPFVIIIGPEEANKNVVQLKNMKTGEKKDLSMKELLNLFCHSELVEESQSRSNG